MIHDPVETRHPAPRPERPRPWRVLAFLVPVMVVAAVVAGVLGAGYGSGTATGHARAKITARARDGARSPYPTPTAFPPEPFMSSMPRPLLTDLRSLPPRTVVGSPYAGRGTEQVLSPNLPFSFRVPGRSWAVDVTPPGQDIAYSEAYSRPTGGETPVTSPLRVVFAWRACGRCGSKDAAPFDRRFERHFAIASVHLSAAGAGTWYAEQASPTHYNVFVRRLYRAPDGRAYLVDYLVRSTARNRATAQQLANEIRTQTS
ncbi:MAG: hypothetical protein J2P24_05915 [Streptosporangiales bacterium]|nr:hypothetical protein [Streptosporangiales bacterium]MBO0890639.1 hypothetical protein [Acidothermales bacterium]